MSIWTAGDWQPFLALVPRVTINGRIVWGWVERRWLNDRRGDGYDHLRTVRTVWQYRALQEHQP